MKILVVFDFPNIKDVESNRADFEVALLADVLNNVSKEHGLSCHITEVYGDDNDAA